MCVECTCFLSGEWNSHHNEHCPVSIVREKDKRIRELEQRFRDENERKIEWKIQCLKEQQENAKLCCENEELKGRLSGDPHLTATKEQREMWRLSAVRYSDKVDRENAKLRDRIARLEAALREIELRRKEACEILEDSE